MAKKHRAGAGGQSQTQQSQGSQQSPSRGAYESYDDEDLAKGRQGQEQAPSPRVQDDGRKPSLPAQDGEGRALQNPQGNSGERALHGEDLGDKRAVPAPDAAATPLTND